jgi:hypothetical protein
MLEATVPAFRVEFTRPGWSPLDYIEGYTWDHPESRTFISGEYRWGGNVNAIKLRVLNCQWDAARPRNKMDGEDCFLTESGVLLIGSGHPIYLQERGYTMKVTPSKSVPVRI